MLHETISKNISFSAILNEKQYVMNNDNNIEKEERTNTPTVQSTGIYTKLIKQALLLPGQIVSMSILLNQKSTFRKQNGLTGKALMEKVIDNIREENLGEVETFTIPANKTKVIY